MDTVLRSQEDSKTRASELTLKNVGATIYICRSLSLQCAYGLIVVSPAAIDNVTARYRVYRSTNKLLC